MPARVINAASDGLMILSEEAQIRLGRITTDLPTTDLPVPEMTDLDAVAGWRAEQHLAWGEDVLAGEALHQEILAGGVRTLWAGPTFDRTDTTQTAVVYLHGGGFCLGSPGTAAPITARLARTNDAGQGLSIVSVDYRLAPEHPFPAALDDAERVVATLLDGRRLILAGDSAGANLAFGLWQRLGSGRVAGIIGLSPLLDLRPLFDRRRASPVGGSGLVAAYVGRADPEDPLLSPSAMTEPQLTALPPVLLQTTPGDPLHPAAVVFAQRIEAVGGVVEHQVWEGLWHAWQYHRELPEAQTAVDLAAEFARTQLAAAGGIDPRPRPATRSLASR